MQYYNDEQLLVKESKQLEELKSYPSLRIIPDYFSLKPRSALHDMYSTEFFSDVDTPLNAPLTPDNTATTPNLLHRNSMITGGSLTPLEDMGLIIQTNIPDATSYNFLLVDDNPINLRILDRVLSKIFPLLMIKLLLDSTKVAEMVANEDFDLVFVDIEMPVIDGIEITRRLRSEEKYDSWGIIAVTTRVKSEDLMEYSRAGIDYTFRKPLSFDCDYLMDVVRGVMRRRKALA